MLHKPDKNKLRKIRHLRVRNKLHGTTERPRFNVYRSLKHIYVQIIDDTKGMTLVAASSVEPEIKAAIAGKTKRETAKIVGLEAARKAIAKDIKSVVFDRGGYLYTGRVAEVAAGAREGGLEF